MKQIKILQLSSNIGFFGAENVIVEIAKGLSCYNYQPIIGVFFNSQNPHDELIKVAQQYKINTQTFNCNGRFDIKTIFAIRKYVRTQNIEIIHSHGYKTNIYGLLATRFMNLPLVSTCHPWIETSLLMKIYAAIDKLCLTQFDKVVAISDHIEKKLLSYGISKDRISIISNGVDINRFHKNFDRNRIAREMKLDPDSIIIGTIGRLSEEKGHIYLIEAIKRVREVNSNIILIFVGDGQLREMLQNKTAELGLQKHVRFLGIQRDIPKILSLIDIFVLPSLSEGVPMVILEAMAAKKPIIATNVGAIPNILSHNETGIIVTPRDHNGIANAILALLKDPDKLADLGHKAYLKVNNKYSSKIMVKKYIEIYNDLALA